MSMKGSLLTSAALVVLVATLGGLTGWYFFLRTHSQSIRAADSARGFSDTSIPGILGAGIAPTTGSAGVTPAGGIASTSDLQASATTGATSSVLASLSSSTTSAPATPRYWHAAKTPVAGFGFVKSSTGYVIRYAERATGYVYSADPWTGDVERLSNTLRPKTQEAYFASSTVIERSFENGTLDTWSGETGRTATSTALIGGSLGPSIASVSLNPLTASLFTIRASGGGAEGVISLPDGTRSRSVFSSTLTGWKPISIPGHTIVVQKASDGVPGYAYEIGKTGSLTKLVGNIPGLMVLPKASSTSLMWSSSRGGIVSLFAQASTSAPSQQLSLSTIAEKCLWAPQSLSSAIFAYCAVPRTIASPRFLDEWHQGLLFTEDSWWQVDAAAGASQALYTSSDRPDVRDPQIDPTGRFIAFIDGRDSSLWVLRVVQ